MLLRKVPPAGVVTLPVSLDAAKSHLRVDFSQDDTLIVSLIETARDFVENVLGRSLINQSWEATLERFPYSPRIVLPIAPLQSVTSVAYYDSDGAAQTLSSGVYEVLKDDVIPGCIELIPMQEWPSTQERINAVTVTFVAGYGATVTTVPSAARQAMLLLIGHWYKNREATDTAVPKDIELGVGCLLRTIHTGYVAGSWQQ